jgi:hypothetical protein
MLRKTDAGGGAQGREKYGKELEVRTSLGMFKRYGTGVEIEMVSGTTRDNMARHSRQYRVDANECTANKTEVGQHSRARLSRAQVRTRAVSSWVIAKCIISLNSLII